MLTLYQAEWCPFSSAVREILSELGLDFVARQVEAWPEDRAGLRAVFGSDEIPILEIEDGRFFVGTRAIYGYLTGREPEQIPDPQQVAEASLVGRVVQSVRPLGPVAAGQQADLLVVADGAGRRAHPARQLPDPELLDVDCHPAPSDPEK